VTGATRWWQARAVTREPLPREFRVVFAGTLVNRVGTFVEPFLILYLTSQRGFTPAQAGLILAAYGLGSMASQVVGGWLTDHVGRRATLAGSLFASAASLVALGAARGAVAITVAAVLVGLFGDMYRPASQALVADVVPPERRPYAFGLIYWAVNVGFAVAGVTAGYLAEQGYWLLFVFDALTCAIFAVVVLVGIRRDPPRAQPPGSDETAAPPPGYGTVLRDGVFLVFLLATALQAIAYFQSFVVLPLAVVDAGLSPSAYGIVAATNGIVVVVLQPLFVRLTADRDSVLVIAVALVISGVGFWLLTFAASLGAFVLVTVVWTLGEVILAGHPAAVVSDLADPRVRGRYLGAFGFAFGVAGFVAPLVGPAAYQGLGPSWVWTACLILFVASAVIVLAARPAVRSRRAAISAGSDAASTGPTSTP
jgi:MFS family permease